MSSIRVYNLAKDLGISSKVAVDILQKIGVDVSSHMSTITEEDKNKLLQAIREASTKNQQKNKSNTQKMTTNSEGQKSKNEKPQPVKNDSSHKSENRHQGGKKQDAPRKDNQSQKQNRISADNKQNIKKQKSSVKKDFPQTDSEVTQNKKNKGRREERDDVRFDRKKNQENSKKDRQNVKNQHAQNKNQKHKKQQFDEEQIDRPAKKSRGQKRRERNEQLEKENLGKEKTYNILLPITVKDFAESIDVSISEVIKNLMTLGIMATQNENLDEDVIMLLADELNRNVEIGLEDEDQTIEEIYELDHEDEEDSLKSRPPVITVMGHVDHGKTSLLDVIKHTHVTDSEAGGITQHIGAYTVSIDGHVITFLDTPGHEAFTSMRSRGASLTDIAILVVAADDGIMPQSIEAINHAKAAEVPIIVAINKIDREGANPDRVKQQLTEHGLVPEDWGGDTITVNVSAKTQEGIPELLDMIQLVAEVQELKANPDRLAVGTVVEAKLDKGKGPMATVLVQKGTLHHGDNIVTGTAYGSIRAMSDDKKRMVKKAGPSTPVVILGLNEVPNAGDIVYAVESDKIAREVATKNSALNREEKLANTNKLSLENLFDKIKEGELKDLNLIVKADVKGTVEAINQSLLKLSNDEVKINIIHSGAGGINESDINLAAASDALVIGFNVRPNNNALELSRQQEVEVRTYRVIYDIINDIKDAVSGMLEPDIVEEILGRCEVRDTFKLPNNSIVAGIYVTSGKIIRNGLVKVLREDIVIHEGPISSLKRFKDDAKEIAQGYEGGLMIENFNDIQIGDQFECYIEKEVKKEL